MNKLYDLIINDINNLDNIDDDANFKELVSYSLSESRIIKLNRLIEEYYKKRYPNNIPPTISMKELGKVSEVLNRAEEELADDVDSIINEIKKVDVALIDIKEADTKDYIYTSFSNVYTAMEKTVSLGKELGNTIIKPSDVFESAKKETSNLLLAGFKKNVIDTKLDREYTVMKEFADQKEFKIDNEKKAEPEEVFEGGFNVIDALTINAINKIDNYLEEFEEDDFDDSKVLAPKILKSVVKYANERTKFLKDNPGSDVDFAPLGKYLFSLKLKVGNSILDSDEIYLGNDKDSNFIKEFLNEPVSCITEYCDKRSQELEERDLFQDRFFEGEDTNIDFQARIKNYQILKNYVSKEQANYNYSSNGKIDLWDVKRNRNRNLFLEEFKKKMNDLKVSDALKNNKGGFFENLFGTTSKQYREFSLGLEQIIEDGPGKGDFDGLLDKADAYLDYKLKSYDSGADSYDEKEFEKLDSTSKGRVRLCLTVKKAIIEANNRARREDNPIEDYDKILKGDILLDFQDIAKLNEQFNVQDDFQKNLKDDSEIDNSANKDNIVDFNNEIENNEINKD